MLLELGNERSNLGTDPACSWAANSSCVEAFFAFGAAAQRRADELGLGPLPLVMNFAPWGMFDPANAELKAIVQRAAAAGLAGAPSPASAGRPVCGLGVRG